MAEKPTPEQLRALREKHGSVDRAAIAIGVPRDVARVWFREEMAPPAPLSPDLSSLGTLEDRDSLVHGLVRRKKSLSIEELADRLDTSPKQIRASLERLRQAGYRVPEEGGEVRLAPVPITKGTVHRSLLDGDEITFAVVSDTHLSSKECALSHLELAYDYFVERGITEVYHAGDIVAGRNIYRTQDQDLTRFTFESQVSHAVEDYPTRDNVTTYLIGGNHDLEGDFGRMGADPCAAISNRRDDIRYLGAYSGIIELVNGAHVQLVHGRGGGGYAVSYKPQRYVEGLPSGRKPALIIFGHWHISGFFRHRNVSLLLGGCFEWQTSLLVRLGLQPDVGFWIVTMRLADDGSVVGILPEWHPFYEGREVVG